MKALFINTNYKIGGAALAASRLADGLKRLSVETSWYVKNLNTSVDHVHPFRRKMEDRWTSLFFNGRVTYCPYIRSTKMIVREDWWKTIDILHFHNLHGDYFNYKTIAYLTAKNPAVWTLHDMWAFTGHCAYSKNCKRWMTGCGRCPDLLEYPAIKSDHTHFEWSAKRKTIRKSKIHVVAPSRWLAQLAENSFLNQHPISVIPYGLDTDCFSPKNKKSARDEINIDKNSFTILLCSDSLTDPRKPQKVLCDGINNAFAKNTSPLQVITFGNGSISEHLNPEIRLHEFGYVNSDQIKGTLFSAADVFLFASRADNLPLVIQESLSCGTPVIANCIGGIPDMVIDGETGWMLPDLEPAGYSKAIEEAFMNKPYRNDLSLRARAHAVKHYSLIESAKKYRAIYDDLLMDR